MAKGLAVPVRPGKNGGAQIVSGSEQGRKILTLAIAPGDDQNPFQSLGIDERIVFQNPDSSVVALIRNSIGRIVGKYPDKYKLTSAGVQIAVDAGGDTNVKFSYKEVDSGDEAVKTVETSL